MKINKHYLRKKLNVCFKILMKKFENNQQADQKQKGKVKNTF